ncbi:MAG: ATP-binding protein [Microcoleaceae cyanobacterium]
MEELLKILIIDDDEVDRLAVQRALRKAGVKLEVSEAENCSSGINQLQQNRFDCVFLDYRLPDQDGLSLLKQVQALQIRVPLIVLTGQGDEQIAVELMKAGASDYLSKSRVSPERLWQVVRSAIRVYQAEEKAERAYQKLQETNQLLLRKNRELERQQQQIELQNHKLAEASRLKSEFLATMSHELRTPMNSITGFSQLLLRPSTQPLSPQQADMVQRIFSNTQHLLTMLNEILDFSKIEAGQVKLQLQKFDLAQLVRLTVEELRSLALEKHLTVHVKIEMEDPFIINDPKSMRQVLVNLLSNAIKFTSVGEVLVKVYETQDSRIVLEIKDTGIGIAPEQIAHIFEAFRQVNQTTTKKYYGTGLGLAIVDSIVTLMKAEKKVESEVGKGSTFIIKFPRYLSDCSILA